MQILNKILNIPFFYNLTQLILGMDFFSVAKKFIEKYPHASVLEIGCGPEGLAKHIIFKNYLGIDMNDSYISNARKKYETKNIRYLKLDIKKIENMKQHFNLLIIINVIHHISDKDLDYILKKIAANVNFDKLIVFDGRPNIGPLGKILEKLDQGDNFRELSAIENIFKQHFIIEKATVVRKSYWIYKYPLVVARKK